MQKETMESKASISAKVRDKLGTHPHIDLKNIEEVGNDLRVTYHIENNPQSSFEVRDQYKRGHSTAQQFELVNGTLSLFAPRDFDEENVFESAEDFAKSLHESASANFRRFDTVAAPNLEEGRTITISHNNVKNIESYLQWVQAIATEVSES